MDSKILFKVGSGSEERSFSVQNMTKIRSTNNDPTSSLHGLSSWPCGYVIIDGVSSKGRGESKIAVSSSMQGETPSVIVATSPNSTRTICPSSCSIPITFSKPMTAARYFLIFSNVRTLTLAPFVIMCKPISNNGTFGGDRTIYATNCVQCATYLQ